MIRVGPAGWSYADWEGIVYPKPKPRGFHPLPFLAERFDCVEVNSTFYAMPRAENSERWAELIQGFPDFRFLAKLHQDFTHGPAQEPRDYAQAQRQFRDGIAPLQREGRLGALLAQFPVTFRATKATAARIERLAETWRDDTPLAVELRHASWFTDRAVDWLRGLGVALLHIDLPAAKDHPPDEFAATSRLAYYRLHGRNAANWFRKGAGRDDRYDYLYAPGEVADVVEKARRLAGTSDDLYVVTNNHFAGQAVANAFEIAAGLGGAPVDAPETLVERYPRLAPISKSQAQQRLF